MHNFLWKTIWVICRLERFARHNRYIACLHHPSYIFKSTKNYSCMWSLKFTDNYLKMKQFFILCITGFFLSLNAENYYDKFFITNPKTRYNDSLFERVIWHKKVSFLTIESITNGYYVTMLVIPETLYNYKAKTYSLHYYFKNYDEAFKKFTWVDDFLKKKGIMKVKISGSLILEEAILSESPQGS